MRRIDPFDRLLIAVFATTGLLSITNILFVPWYMGALNMGMAAVYTYAAITLWRDNYGK